MKKYKKIITGLILALICAIMPFVSVVKAKALTVDDITTVNDLKNTVWIVNQNIPETTASLKAAKIYSSDGSTINVATFEYGENLVNVVAKNNNYYNIYFSYGMFGTNNNTYFRLLDENSDSYSLYSSSFSINSQFDISPRKLTFLNWTDGQIVSNNEAIFIELLKIYATFNGVVSENSYKITFNLNGGTSEQPEDIEFNTSITINKNDLPTPTRENYKFLYWAWADTDNIEYAEPFTQESLTFTDTDIYMWAIWTLYDVNMVFHLNNILILDARLIFAELEQPEEIAGEVIDKIAKIELIGDNVTTFKMIISTLSVNPMLESSSPYISYILNYTNHVEIGFNFNSEYLNSISATSLYNVAEWTNIEQDTSFNDYLEIYINKPGQVIEVELESAKLVNDDIDNINTGANAVFSIISNFLNINIGFLTVGSIIAVLLAVAVLGFIIKIWQGGNNG